MPQSKRKQTKGFTLIEVLVALIIFATLSALSYRSLSALIQTHERIETETTRWRDVMVFFNRLESDFRQSVNRPVTLDKTLQAAWLAKPNYLSNLEAQLSFSKMGDSQQNGLLMDTQRIGYRLKSGTIEMLIWPALDNESTSRPNAYPILTGVKSMSIRYMQHQTHRWVDFWPISEQDTKKLPKAVEVRITLQTGEKLNRVYHLQ